MEKDITDKAIQWIKNQKDTAQELGPEVGPMITAGADFSTKRHRILIEDAASKVTGGLALLFPQFVALGNAR